MANNAKLYYPNMTQMLEEAGIDPITRLPIRAINRNPLGATAEEIYQSLKEIDKQNAITRFTYYNLPEGLNAEIIERILYYRGSLALFKLGDRFYSLPYTLNGNIDIYGRYEKISPLPFNGTSKTDDDGRKHWVQNLEFEVIHEVPYLPELAMKSDAELRHMLESSCVIMRDRSCGLSQMIEPRERLNDPIIKSMSLMIPYLQTNLLAGTGIKGMRVDTESDAHNVWGANEGLRQAALQASPLVPIIGGVDFQELTNGSAVPPEQYLLTMESLDNLRLSFLGIDNSGLFQKKAHMLQSEQDLNSGQSSLTLENDLRERQKALTIFNTMFGTSAWVEISENQLGADKDGDGIIGQDGEDANNAKAAAEAVAADEGGTNE